MNLNELQPRSLLENTGEGCGAAYLQLYLTPSPVCGHSLYWILHTQQECLKTQLSNSDTSPDLLQPLAKSRLKNKTVEVAKLSVFGRRFSRCFRPTYFTSVVLLSFPTQPSPFTLLHSHQPTHHFLLLCLLLSSSFPLPLPSEPSFLCGKPLSPASEDG